MSAQYVEIQAPLDLVGLCDVALRVGVDRNTPYMWQFRGQLPPPIAILNKQTPVWEWTVLKRHLDAVGLPSRTPTGQGRKRPRAHDDGDDQ